MMGDFNSTPPSNANGNGAAYRAVTGAGFEDAWSYVRADTPGDTCCQQPDLKNSSSELNRRIDFIFTRGTAKAISAGLTGGHPGDRTSSGLWPSDHAGLVATIELS